MFSYKIKIIIKTNKNIRHIIFLLLKQYCHLCFCWSSTFALCIHRDIFWYKWNCENLISHGYTNHMLAYVLLIKDRKIAHTSFPLLIFDCTVFWQSYFPNWSNYINIMIKIWYHAFQLMMWNKIPDDVISLALILSYSISSIDTHLSTF